MFRVLSNRLRHKQEPRRQQRLCTALPRVGSGVELTEVEVYAPHHASKHPGYQLRYYSQTSQRMASQHHRPKPPPYFCFTVPSFQLVPFLESLFGLLFTNFLWVGLWDLLDNTIFPNDDAWQMYLLVVLGLLGLYFTNSLYEPPQGRFPQPMRAQARELTAPAQGERWRWDGAAQGPGVQPTRQAVGEESGLLDNGDFVDEPFVPPRFEFRRFGERVIANIAAVLLWTGVWNQIDDNALPLICSYNACGDCIKYGEFPCAWYKIGFILVGIAGMYVTRGLYCDHEVTYKQRRKAARCCGCGWTAPGGQTARR